MKKLFFLMLIVLMCQISVAQDVEYTLNPRTGKFDMVRSATSPQSDYVLEKLADTAKITDGLHAGKTCLVLDDGSGKWREWWYYMGKWQPKTGTGNSGNDGSDGDNGSSYTLPPATTWSLGGVIVGEGLNVDETGWLSVYNPEEYNLDYSIPVGEYLGLIPFSEQTGIHVTSGTVMRSTYIIFVKTPDDLRIDVGLGLMIVDARIIYRNYNGKDDHSEIYAYDTYTNNYNNGSDYFRIKFSSSRYTSHCEVETSFFSEAEAADNAANNFYELVPGYFITDYIILTVDIVVIPV